MHNLWTSNLRSRMTRRAAMRLRWLASALGVVAVPATAVEIVPLDAPPYSVSFGARMTVLTNGWIVVTDPHAPAPDGAANAGAVHVYRPTGERAATIRGGAANSLVGIDTDHGLPVPSSQPAVQPIGPGRFVLRSPFLDRGGLTDVGAVTLVDVLSATDLVISPDNSIVGSSAQDRIGIEPVFVLPDGDLAVTVGGWDHGGVVDAGAIRFVAADEPFRGFLSAATSLVGPSAGSRLSGLRHTWPDGRALILCQSCNTSGLTMNGLVKVIEPDARTGIVGAEGALVGSKSGDRIGNGDIEVLASGKVLVFSHDWGPGSVQDAGAVTLIAPDAPPVGQVTAQNSLVGSRPGDLSELSLLKLPVGSYLIGAPFWDNGNIEDAGAAVFGSAVSGVTGTISASNALIGSQAGDEVGLLARQLANGNFVVRSPRWNNGLAADAGAASFGSMHDGVSGVVSSANSLVGTSSGDGVGSRVVALANGNYVVHTQTWDGPAGANQGAVTWASGATGVAGPITSTNSLVGNRAGDALGTNVIALPNGNYVIGSPYWSNGPADNVGAVMLARAVSPPSGPFDPGSALVGTRANDQVGLFLDALNDGNWLTRTPYWAPDGSFDHGAATWGSANIATSGVVSPQNSLVGARPGEQLGFQSLRRLENGGYLMRSPSWSDGAAANLGAIASGVAGAGVSGVMSPAVAVVGTSPEGGPSIYVAVLTDGSCLVTARWTGANADANGALVHYPGCALAGPLDGSTGLTGVTAGAWATQGPLRTGHLVVWDPYRDNGPDVDAGAVVVVRPTEFPTTPSPLNAVAGATTNAGVVMRTATDQARSLVTVTDPQGGRVTQLIPGQRTQISVVPAGTAPFPPGSSVTFTATIVGATSPPTDGELEVWLDDGSRCIDSTPTALAGLSTAFSCSIDSARAGTRRAWAEYRGSTVHAYAGVMSEPFVVLPDAILIDGFEASVPAAGR